MIVPAFNEAAGIERAVRSLAASDYPELEVVVVDDGSTDGTGEIVESLELPSVRVIRQANAARPRRSTPGIAPRPARDHRHGRRRHGVRAGHDPRSWSSPFADPWVGRSAGNTKVGNRRGLLGRWQHIDYVIGFNLDRRLYDVLRCMPTVPGAVGAFRRTRARRRSAASPATPSPRTPTLTIAIGRAGWRVVYAEDARAWTEAPATLGGLWRQRYRWSYGTMQAVWKHRGALSGRQRRHGSAGSGLPYLIAFQILLPLLAPLIDLFALYGVLFLDPLPVLAYWLGFNVLLLRSPPTPSASTASAAAALGAAAAAVRLPPADVPGRHPVDRLRVPGHPAALGARRASGDVEVDPRASA